MRHGGILFLALLVIANGGCDEEITEATLPFEEMLVIRGIVKAGDVVDSLYIGRTLPYETSPGSNQEVENFVADAAVTVSNGAEIFPMTYTGSGYYKNDSLVGESGSTYHLHVEWNGKTADATTTIPDIPILDSVSATSQVIAIDEFGGNDVEYTSQGYCRTKKNNVLSLYMGIEIVFSYMGKKDTSIMGPVKVGVAKRTQTNDAVPDIFFRNFRSHYIISPGVTILNQRAVFTLTSYDEAYYKYYLTFGNDENSISVEPKPVAWNVTGDAIGMFIGASESVTKVYQLQ